MTPMQENWDVEATLGKKWGDLPFRWPRQTGGQEWGDLKPLGFIKVGG